MNATTPLDRRFRPLTLAGLSFILGAITAPEVLAETAMVHASHDATLIESPAGDLANGSGPAIFAGRVAASSQSLRRALVMFDVAGAVPAGATITGAQLRLNLSSTSAGPVAVAMHRVLAAWGEGASSAAGGGGAPAITGDATWRHRFYDGRFWANPGGDFDPVAAAAAIVDQPGAYAWGPTAALVADAQSWLDLPDRNHGWVLVGDETRPQTVKRFDAREGADAALSPVLEITYLPLCDPAPAGLGFWKRVCAPPEKSAPEAGAPEPPAGEVDRACAARLVSALLLPPFDPCTAVLAEPPLRCEERARRSLAILILNVCAGRLQTTCDAPREDPACLSTSVGDRLFEAAALLRAGDCRTAASCAALPE